jgi:glycosyltransferase involved in cell wall biosynthesis
MQRKQCVIIPVYNQHQFIESSVNTLLPYNNNILLVDDGSNEICHQVLEDLIKKYSTLKLFTLPKNQGKGAAVIRGLLEAKKLGYTHALQIDADGQHNSDDITAFTNLSEKHPHDVISGLPIYDDSIPKGRLYGRYITHFWVWVETLSFSIKDSMCGFRIYPVNKCCELIEKTPVGKRMDFDT